MYTDVTKIEPPSDDKRWRIVGATMRRHGYQPNALIETLHTVQESFGCLDDDALRYICAVLRVPPSQIYGVATFYQFFTLKPKEAGHTCVVCQGTACHLKGGESIISAIEQAFHLKVGKTTSDGKLYLQTARCLGSCGLAPVAVFDGELVGKLNRSSTLNRLQEIVTHDA